MAREADKSNLGYLGLDFQYKLVKIFVENAKFFEDISAIVDQNSFTDPLLRTFVGVIKDYFSKNGSVPSYDTIRIILRASKSKTNIDIEQWEAVINKLSNEISSEGYDVIKDNALKFFKQQNLIKVANKILEIASSGDLDRYNECQKMLDDVAMIGQDDDFGHSIYDLEEKALSNEYTVSIPTGIKPLDDVLGGGLDKGKLGLLIAPAGFGKTSFTTSICANAAAYKCDMNNNKGFKVLQIYFEDDDVDIARKHFSKITEHEARIFKRLNPDERQEIEELINNFKDKELLKENLLLKRFRTGEKSATDIEIFVKKLINHGFKPDLISIDYFECVAAEKGGYSSDTEWTREGVTMRKFENMAQEFNCAIWIPTQGTKDSMNSPDVVRMDQASGSAKKIHVAQLILSIARSLGDIDNNRAVISVLKNRSGKSGKVFNNVKFDNGTCTISCDEVEEHSDLEWDEEAEKRKEQNRNRMIRSLSEKPSAPSVKGMENNYNQSNDPVGNFVGYVNGK